MGQRLIIVMGPSGCGKSRISAELANAMSAPWLEGDDYHPPRNKAKMASGTPLDDADRAAWIDEVLEAIDRRSEDNVILACSALTRSVQQRLEGETARQSVFVVLEAPRDVIAQRIERRTDHFMPAELLNSQLAALQLPENCVRIDANQQVDAIVAEITRSLEQQA